LVHALERASGRNLGRWADAWVQRRGMPTVRVVNGRLEQTDALGEGGVWPMKLRIWNSSRFRDVFLEKKSLKIKLPTRPGLVFPNAGDFGYGRFLLDRDSLEAVLAPSFEPGSTLLQAQLLEAVWESVREAQLAPERFLAWALGQIPRTRDDVALAGLLARIETAFRRYLDDAQRDALAPALERVLGEDGATGSRSLLLTRALIEVAWSAQALGDLKRRLDDASLASRDRFRIVQRLYVRDDPDAPARLAAQAAADPGDDGRRYAYAAAAATAQPGAKRELFRAFVEDQALPESWIESALGPFNAPEQASATQPLLGEALARLPELKRSRRIFFVGNWLAAFIGGQTGPGALAEVEAFLQRRDLDADLRLKLLEAMDGLERAIRIRKRFGSRSDAG
jgi:aminopeptidase N